MAPMTNAPFKSSKSDARACWSEAYLDICAKKRPTARRINAPSSSYEPAYNRQEDNLLSDRQELRVIDWTTLVASDMADHKNSKNSGRNRSERTAHRRVRGLPHPDRSLVRYTKGPYFTPFKTTEGRVQFFFRRISRPPDDTNRCLPRLNRATTDSGSDSC